VQEDITHDCLDRHARKERFEHGQLFVIGAEIVAELAAAMRLVWQSAPLN
jgi:hypothetical protein